MTHEIKIYVWILFVLCVFALIGFVSAFVLLISFFTVTQGEKKIGFKFFLNNININIMGQTRIMHSQFKDGVIKGFIKTLEDHNIPEPVEGHSVIYKSSNEQVATVAPDPADETKYAIAWVGPGSVQITSEADADTTEGVSKITGMLDLLLEEDKATKIDMQLDPLSMNWSSQPNG